MTKVWIALFGLMLLVGVAWADKPVVVVTGDDAAVVGAVEKAMKGKVTVVGESERERATAVVEVTVTPTGKAAKRAKKLTATVTVTQTADGAEVGKMVVKERKAKLPKTVGKQVWKKVGKAVMNAKRRVAADEPVAVAEEPPAPAPTPTPAPAAAPADPSAPIVPSETRAEARVESKDAVRFLVSVSERPFYRRLRWNDDLDDVLRRYDLAANAVGVSVSARPLASAKGLFVGVDGELVVGVNGSRTDDGMSYGTSASELSAALGYSVRIARADVAVSAAYGEQRFAIDDEAMVQELVPDVTYRWARGGLDAAVPMGKWTLLVRGGWRHLLGVGELEDWFPRQTGNGLDASVGAAIGLTRWLGAYARAEVRHYFFAMNPEPGDENIAGGAVDTFLGGSIGLAVSIR